MSLILDALKRLEAKAPPKPPVVTPSAPTAPAHVEPPSVASLKEPTVVIESQAVVFEPIEISVAGSPPEDWFEQTELTLSGPELIEQDADVQLSVAALQGDVLNLDLEVKAQVEAPTTDATPEVVAEKPTEDEDKSHDLAALAPMIVDEESIADAVEPEPDTIDFASQLAKLWEESDADVVAEPAQPATPIDAEVVDDVDDATISFGPLDEELLPIHADLPAGARDDVADTDVIEEVVIDDDVAEDVAVERESEAAVQDVADEIDERAADAACEPDVPSGAILPIADFRPATAEPPTPQHDELDEDHDVLAAQLAELEYRGLRENVLSQLPDAPAALLFAAPDDETAVAEVVLRLGQSLAQLNRGEVAIICSTRLRDAYRASSEYGDLHQVFASSHKHRRVPTLMIDPADAGDRLVADMKRRCRWVLFAADTATARRWSPLCDATYVVVGLGNTDRQAAVRSVTALELAGGLVLGCVLTEVPDVA